MPRRIGRFIPTNLKNIKNLKPRGSSGSVSAPNITAVEFNNVGPIVGDTVTAVPTYSGAGTVTLTYQWARLTPGTTTYSDISGATAAAYTIQAADDKKVLRCRVTATNAGGATSRDRYLAILIPTANRRTGFDFRTCGPATPPLKVPGVDALPSGWGFNSSTRNITVTGSTGVVSGWDFDNTNIVIGANCNPLTISGCKFGPKLSDLSGIPIKVSGGNSNVTLENNEFTGKEILHSVMVRIDGGNTTSSLTVRRNKFHKLGSDCINGGPNLTVEENWFRDGGYVTGAHLDPVQCTRGDNITIRRNLVDGTTDGIGNTNSLDTSPPVEINNAFRVGPDDASVPDESVSNVLIENNVVLHESLFQSWLYIANPTGSQTAANYTIKDNAVHFNTSNNWNGGAGITGTKIWSGNVRLLDEVTIITGPPDFATGVEWQYSNLATAPVLDYDAQDAATITHSGGALSRWNNKGSLGANQDLIQATSANQPAYSATGFDGVRASVTFTQADIMTSGVAWNKAAGPLSALHILANSAVEIVGPYSAVATAAGFASLARYRNTANDGTVDDYGMYGRGFGTGATGKIIGPSGGTTSPHIVYVSISAGGNVLRINGQAVTPDYNSAADSLATNAVVNMSAGNFTGAAAEWSRSMVFTNTHTLAEIEKLEGRAAHDHGLTALLPAGHPYKTNPPTV